VIDPPRSLPLGGADVLDGGLVGGCDEREAEPIEGVRSCLGEDPAAYVDREEQTLLAEAQPEHPQCNGEVATEPGGEDILARRRPFHGHALGQSNASQIAGARPASQTRVPGLHHAN